MILSRATFKFINIYEDESVVTPGSDEVMVSSKGTHDEGPYNPEIRISCDDVCLLIYIKMNLCVSLNVKTTLSVT